MDFESYYIDTLVDEGEVSSFNPTADLIGQLSGPKASTTGSASSAGNAAANSLIGGLTGRGAILGSGLATSRGKTVTIPGIVSTAPKVSDIVNSAINPSPEPAKFNAGLVMGNAIKNLNPAITDKVRETITAAGFKPSETTASGNQSLYAQSQEIADLVLGRLSPRIDAMERTLTAIQAARDFMSDHREMMRRDRHYRETRQNLALSRQILQAVAEIILRMENPAMREQAIKVFVNKE